MNMLPNRILPPPRSRFNLPYFLLQVKIGERLLSIGPRTFIATCLLIGIGASFNAARIEKTIPASILNHFLDSLSRQGYRLEKETDRDEYVSEVIVKCEKKKFKLVNKFEKAEKYLEKKHPKQFNKTVWKKMFANKKNPTMAAYFKRYRKVAKEEERMYGIPAAVTLVQGALESGCGSSRLAEEAMNHFGIKGHTSFGAIYVHDDCCRSKKCHKPEAFRRYSTVWQSYRDHSKLLQKPNYKSLRRSKDWRDWVAGLERQTYATSRSYTESLAYYIVLYDLDQI
jgi:flagellum-specific peptidoglycan hydrolase FlgJ